MEQFKIPEFPGAVPDPIDERDYQYDQMIMGAAPIIDWNKGYDVENELEHQFKIEHQDGSCSCVGQACSKYAEVLNYFEEKQYVDLSASFIYSQIYLLPGGGAYVRDGIDLVVKKGVAKESILPTYTSDGRPFNETEIREMKNKIDALVLQDALIYQSKSYASVGPTNLNLVADAIQRNKGAITGVHGSFDGWLTGEPRPPLQGESVWGHAIYLTGYGQDLTGRYIKFINSWGTGWGNNGRGKLYEDYFLTGNVFVVWTLVDKQNLNEALMFKTIKLADKPEIYLKSNQTNYIAHIGGWETYQTLLKMKLVKEVEVVPNLDGLEIIPEPFGFLEEVSGLGKIK